MWLADWRELGVPDRDYILGTHQAEIERLGVQHQAWRPYVLDCWRRAGIAAGDRVLDVGAGPGYASFDLAQIVGPAGRVAAVDRSGNFADAARSGAHERDLRNLTVYQRDLMCEPLPNGAFDASWCRWVCSFVERPEVLVRKLSGAIRPGGVAVFHEYVDYASWRYFPPLPLMKEYTDRVMRSWRDAGGEPDIGMELPRLLGVYGFEVRLTEPRVFCVGPSDPLWEWIATFVRSNLRRLADLGSLEADWAEQVRVELLAAESRESSLLLTPAVLEIIAIRNQDER